MSQRRGWAPILVLLLGAALTLHVTAEERVGHEVSGTVITPGVTSMVVKLYTADGQELEAFPELDGAFTFRDVPPGSHMLQPFCVNYFYPEVGDNCNGREGSTRPSLLLIRAYFLVCTLMDVPLPLNDYFSPPA